MNEIAICIYTYPEIISRILFALKPLDGITYHAYSIELNSDNAAAPPYVEVKLYNDCTFTKLIKHYVIDQNTTIGSFESMTHEMKFEANACRQAADRNMSYLEYMKEYEKRRKVTVEQIDDLPF